MTTLTEKPTQPKTRRFSLTQREAKAYINPYAAAIALGVVLFLAFFITGNGLGASGGLNRILVFFEDLIAPEHVDRVAYLVTMAGGAANPLDSWIVMLTVGTLLGGFASGLVNGRVKVETIGGPRVSKQLRWLTAFVGGGLMGYGADEGGE
ncbi:MAG: YeeE/YedE family protein, partial [Chloroflexi bacterium]|nr:hypothetical protein [Chloroflexota bacterium]NOG37154.1 YeeE/YedE family protein [Chloroflexota bacterium]